MFPHRAALWYPWRHEWRDQDNQEAKCEDAVQLSKLSDSYEGASDSALEEDNIREGFSEEATVGWGGGKSEQTVRSKYQAGTEGAASY